MSQSAPTQLSIGQREALRLEASGGLSSSKLEGVMGGLGGSGSTRSQRVIDINDLADEGVEGREGKDGAASTSAGTTSGKGSLEGARTSLAGGTYLQQPVTDGSAWLHNQQMPSVLLKHEKVEHRIMLWFKAQGKSNREVAELLGYSDAQVSQITRQPWFMESLRELLQENGADLVRKMLEGTAVDSVLTLISIRDDTKAPAAVRANVSNALLDRFLGKARQDISIERKESPAERVPKINEELSALEQREAELRKQLNQFTPQVVASNP